jgi:FMN reductase
VPDVVVVSGHPRPGSATLQLATVVGEGFAVQRGHPAPILVDIAALGPGLLTPGDGSTGEALMEVQDASLLIVATPVCNGSYAGVLKALLDQLPVNALAGVVAVPVVTAESQPLADTAEAFLARLLRELGADVVDFGLTATESEFDDLASVADQYVAAFRP